eukprot:1327843-Rhodomonas_salina.2
MMCAYALPGSLAANRRAVDGLTRTVAAQVCLFWLEIKHPPPLFCLEIKLTQPFVLTAQFAPNMQVECSVDPPARNRTASVDTLRKLWLWPCRFYASHMYRGKHGRAAAFAPPQVVQTLGAMAEVGVKNPDKQVITALGDRLVRGDKKGGDVKGLEAAAVSKTLWALAVRKPSHRDQR